MKTLNNLELESYYGGGDNPFRILGALTRGFLNGLFGTQTPIACDENNDCYVP